MMRGWAVGGRPGGPGRLVSVSRDVPEPAADEVLVRVKVCGVCRTDLHLADHDLAPKRPEVIPGHEVVGEVVALGESATRFSMGDRLGIAWLRRTCGTCKECRNGQENLCRFSEYTGWDADGGFAEYAVVPEAFAYELPDGPSDEEVAPLLCSGIIGYRALIRTNVPSNGTLGIYGFGASAHLTAQLAIAEGLEVHVVTRDEGARHLAMELGAASACSSDERPPVALDGAILFAPVGSLVPVALSALEQGATLAVAGIHLSDIPALDYKEHLFRERTLTSVTANTRADGEELLAKASALDVRARVTSYAFDDVDQALTDLADGRITGAAVARIGEG
ncbi:zinc-dependent alcohol dehydrogenase family protein [Aeromicrobium sp.]|uniref:zinc-dependent alcohol dehydrogenase family protein n=1 Tax=Aeromicrobium sp. TaxID=1871063 RepID=UPI003D6BFFF9